MAGILDRRSPTIQYIACSDAREAKDDATFQNLLLLYVKERPQPEEIDKAVAAVLVAQRQRANGSNANSDDPCPGLDVIKESTVTK